MQQARWNPVNGNYLLTGSKDQKIKLYDLRNMKQEDKEIEGHKGSVLVIQWHPFKEEIFASADAEGQISFWK